MNEQDLINSINQQLPDNQQRRIKAENTRNVLGDFLAYTKDNFATKEELSEYGSSAIVGIYDDTKLPTDYPLFDANKVNRFIVNTDGIGPFISPAAWGSITVNFSDIENNEVFFIYESDGSWKKYVKRVKGDAGANGTGIINEWVAQNYISGAQVAHAGKFWKAPAGANGAQVPGEDAAWIVVIKGAEIHSDLDFNTKWADKAISQKFVAEQNLKDGYTTLNGVPDWCLINPNEFFWINWDSLIFGSHVIVPGSTLVWGFIPVDDTTEYRAFGIGNMFGVCFDENQQWINYIYIPNNTAFTFLPGTKWAFVRNGGFFGPNIPKDQYENKFDVKLPLEKIKDVSRVIDLNIREANVSSINELNIAEISHTADSYSVVLPDDPYAEISDQLGAYYMQATLNIGNIHKAAFTNKIFSLKNSLGNERLSVEILSEIPGRNIGMPNFTSKIQLSVDGTPAVYQMMDMIHDSVTSEQPFAIKVRLPEEANPYEFITAGEYDQAKEENNYNVSAPGYYDALGWVASWKSNGLELIRYDVTLTGGEGFSLGTTPVQTIFEAFFPNEKIDDFISRIKDLLNGPGFTIIHMTPNRELLCADLIPCEIQMCRLVQPMRMNKALNGGSPSDRINIVVVDAIPAIFHCVYKKDLRITFTFKNDVGYRTYQVIIAGTPMFELRFSGQSLHDIKNTLSVLKADKVIHKIKWSPKYFYKVHKITNITGHHWLARPEFLDGMAPGTRMSVGRMARIKRWFDAQGIKQISIKRAMELMESDEEWTANYWFLTIDDSPAIRTANLIDTTRMLEAAGVMPTAGINSGNLTNEFSNMEFGYPITYAEVNGFQLNHEIFQHGHLHNTYPLSTYRQLEHIFYMSDKVVVEQGIKLTRYFAVPFDAGMHWLGRMVRIIFGYRAVSAHAGDTSGYGIRGSITQGLTRDSSPRVNAEDLTRDEVWQPQVNAVGLYGTPIR